MKAEIVTMLDETLGIWKDAKGYYWVERFECRKSKYFKTERAAIRDCKNLMLVNESEGAK